MKKSWVQKIKDNENFPKVLNLEKNFPCFKTLNKMGIREGEPIVLANPSDIIPIMSKVPKGKITTIKEVCQNIAKKYGVKGCCSLTTGIFIMAIANAVEEEIALGNNSELNKIPYWRTLKVNGFLNEKYPGGLERHSELLQKEGFTIIQRGKKYQVVNFEKYIL
ncbi:MAG: MGMT family protein [Ignavibacteria bacterium]|nr:MGMT family protein [Ignavibacteria bacterium]